MLQNNVNYKSSYNKNNNNMSHSQRRRIFKRKKPPDETQANHTIRFKSLIKTEILLLLIIASLTVVINASDNFILSSVDETTLSNFESKIVGDGGDYIFV